MILNFLIVYIVVCGISLFFLYRTSKKIKQLQATLHEMKIEKTKMSNQLRRKGIEIDKLEKEIKRGL